MSVLADPRIFNFVIMCLYALNAVRWALNGSWGDALYWMGALWITCAVTWGYRH